ncbi:MAG: aminoglycoside phosphotransferase family protein [Vicinamibacteraceae bacterium]
MSDQSQQRVQAYLDRRGRGGRAVRLTSDASDRRYFRVLTPSETPVVIALYPSSFDAERLSFLNVTKLLGEMPIPIPDVLDCAEDLGVLVLEDLGDVTLQAHVGAAPWSDHAALYREAVRLIALLQRRGTELASPQYVPYTVAFDVAKLTWELEFFAKHFLVAYRGAALDEATRAALAEEFALIVEQVAAEPQVLCHRDYHSRNLMLHRGRLYMIDFQDARLGPNTYDLVSLLRDSYVDLHDETVNHLIAYFLALIGQADRIDEFRARFDLMALQRNLKALGTFGYQTTARANPVYIQYIPRTLRHVRDNLASNRGRFGRLHDLLAAHLPELRTTTD